jgi:hypothetical protein
VIARFRQLHEPVFVELFTQVLRLCREVGLARLGTVAIDGTKIAANASKDANHGEDWLRAQVASTGVASTGAAGGERGLVEQILTEAGEVDAAEDALFGAARGDELPPQLSDRGGRRERLARALDRIAEQKAAEQKARQAVVAEQVGRAQARLAALEQVHQQTRARQQDKIDEWERAWEAAIATRGPLPRGRSPSGVDDAIAVRRAAAAVQRARARLTVEGRRGPRRPTTSGGGGIEKKGEKKGEKKPPPRANLTDPDSRLMPTRNGWIQGYNVQFAVSADQVILVLDVTDEPNDVTSCRPMMAAAAAVAADLDNLPQEPDTQPDTQPDTTQPDGLAAPVFLFDAGYASDDNLTAPGPNRLIALGKSHSVTAAARDNPASGSPPPDISAREAMDHRLRTPEGTALYLRRGATVEPAIGNFKKILAGLSRRGRQAALSEGHFAATVFNLLKLYRAAHT